MPPKPPSSLPEARSGAACDRPAANEPAASACARYRLDEEVGSTPAEIRSALVGIARDLETIGIGRHDRDAIEMVLAEVMNNIAEHAYRERPEHVLLLRLFIRGESVFCRIEDDGRPMPGLTLPAGDPQNLAVARQDLPEGGFGWFLIRQLTADLTYARARNRNLLSFRIPLGRKG